MAQTSWREYAAEGDAKYWYNTVTQESVWDTPAEIQQIVDSLEQKERPTNTHSSSYSAAPSSSTSYKDLSKYLSQSPLAPANSTIYHDQEERLAAFKQLLKDKNVDGSVTFQNMMKELIKDPRYWAIEDSVQRKKTFDELVKVFQKEREAQEAEERKEGIEKMVEALENHLEIKYYTRWKTVKDQLQDDPLLNTYPENDRKTAFQIYVDKLIQEHKQQEREEINKSKVLLEKRFEELGVSVKSRWIEIFNTVKKEIENSQYSNLTNLDILDTYSSYVKKIELKSIEERQKIKMIQRRKERKIREAFIDLLDNLRSEGKIKAGTKWTSVLPLFAEDSRYIDICGQPGSTPLELFWDITEEEERTLKLQKELVLDVITMRHFPLDIETPFEKFVEAVKSDSRVNDVSQSNLEVIFEDLKKSASKRKEYDRHAEERKIRRNQDDLRALFKELEPPVQITDTWEIVKKRVESSKEYMTLPTEESRKEAFDRHIRRLKEREHDRDRDYRRDQRRDGRSHRDSRGSQLPPYSSSSRSSNDYRRAPPPPSYYRAPPYYDDPQQPHLEY